MQELKQSAKLLAGKKLLRITTVPMALAFPLSGQPTYMQQNGLEVKMISADGWELPQLLQQETCPHIVVPMTRSITPFRDLKVLFSLIKIFKKEKPDIVHTETPKAGLLGMLAAKFCNVKIRIHTVAGLPLMVEKGIKLWLLKGVERLTYAAATNVWPNSNSLKNFILEHRFTTPSKLMVVGQGSSNGINVERYNKANLDAEILAGIKDSLKYDKALTYLLFVGRLVSDKGIIELVNVFLSLRRTHPNLRLVLVGNYERLLDPLPRFIEDGINDDPDIIHINWTNKVEYFMALADYFVFPSYREGFPNVLLEAAAMELPIICSRIAGNVDIVTDKETGIIFESQDEAALEKAIVTSIIDNARSAAMAGKLHKTIVTFYKREIFWKSMLDEYDILAGSSIAKN